MKVSRTGSASAVSSASKVKKAGGVSETFAVGGAEEAKAAAATTGPGAVQGVDALLALQEVDSVDSEGSRKRRAVARGTDMLDILDEIKVALLEGGVPESKLRALLRVVQAEASLTADPVMNAVIAEIDLRARVELAKFGHFT